MRCSVCGGSTKLVMGGESLASGAEFPCDWCDGTGIGRPGFWAAVRRLLRC